MSTAPFTVMCDGCGGQTEEPTDCIHGRVLCGDCVDFVPCRDCTREALGEAGAA